MNTNRYKSYFLNTLLLVALCAAYCLLEGLLGTIISLLISALLGVVLYREHYGLGIANALLLLVIFVLFYRPLQALTIGIPLILLAVTLALGTRLKLSIYRLLFLCTVLYVLDLLFGMELAGRLTGGEVTLSSMMLEMGRQVRELMLQQYHDPELVPVIEQAVSMVVDMSIMLAPAIFTVTSIVLSYCLILVYKKLQQRQEEDMSFLQPFDSFQSDKLMAVLYLVLFLLVSAAPAGLFFDAAANVIIILSFLFMAVGMSVLDRRMKQSGTTKTHRRLILAAILFSLPVFFLIPVLALVACGLSDAFFDFRHLRPGEPKQE